MGIQSKWKPSEDLMSKLALSHSKIIDLVVPFIAGNVSYYSYKDMCLT